MVPQNRKISIQQSNPISLTTYLVLLYVNIIVTIVIPGYCTGIYYSHVRLSWQYACMWYVLTIRQCIGALYRNITTSSMECLHTSGPCKDGCMIRGGMGYGVDEINRIIMQKWMSRVSVVYQVTLNCVVTFFKSIVMWTVIGNVLIAIYFPVHTDSKHRWESTHIYEAHGHAIYTTLTEVQCWIAKNAVQHHRQEVTTYAIV